MPNEIKLLGMVKDLQTELLSKWKYIYTEQLFNLGRIKSIKYLEDNSGGYYLIEGHNFRDLYDDELNPVK